MPPSVQGNEVVPVVDADGGRAVGCGIEEPDAVSLIHEFGDLGRGEPAQCSGFAGLWGGVAADGARRSLKQAVLWGLVPRNVAKLVDGVSVKAPEKRRFTTAEQAAILDAAKGDRLYVMVVLAHATGLRQSELLGIQWCDVDLDGWRLLLSKQLGRDGQLEDPRSEAGKRVLPLPEFTVAALRVHRKAQERERADTLDSAASAIDQAVADVVTGARGST